jgi:hypothetical protein
MARYHGKAGIVYASTSGSGTATNVASLTEWSINATTDKVETTAFTDTSKNYVQGLPDAQGSFSGFWDDSESKVFAGSRSADGVKLYLYPSKDAPTKYAYGTAWLDFSLNTSVSDAVKMTGNWSAKASWEYGFL